MSTPTAESATSASVEDRVPHWSRPSNSIEAHRVDITVESVLYDLKPQDGIPTCIVVLEIAFKLKPHVGLANAAIPLNLKVNEIPGSSVSAAASRLRGVDHQCYLRDYFTGTKEEKVLLEEYNAHNVININPDVELGVPNGPTIKVGGMGKKTTFVRPVKKIITLVGQCLRNKMQIQWIFENPFKERYPRNVKLMIIVKNKHSPHPYFPFSLDLDKEYKVSPFGEPLKDKVAKWFKRSRPQPIQISGCWEPHIAKDALTDVSAFYDAKPKYIGLRATQPVALGDTS